MADEPGIKIRPDGPYLVTGVDALRRTGIELDEDGRPRTWRDGGEIEHRDVYALCRCGASDKKPFCDGSHSEVGFDGTETADRGPIADRRRVYGSGDTRLGDDKSLCWHAGFCVRAHTKAWDLASGGDGADGELLAEMVHSCPSGRLELIRDGEVVEREYDRRIDVVDDGPLWVRGGVPIETADGAALEVRNRVSLCRCGASRNKPFCDGAHVEANFRDPGDA